MIMRPFWRYFGGKWRLARADIYPAPKHQLIIEPFAGAAGYSLRYGRRCDVLLIEKYATIAAIWRWLIAANPDEIREIPEVDNIDDLPSWVPQAARSLIGFSMNSSASTPRRTLSAGRRKLRAANRQFEGWTPALRERIALQVQCIRHWQVIEGDYSIAPDVEATWFVDAPYVGAGRHYVHGDSKIDYFALADWCRSRRGQPIVCENVGASWLPFRPLGVFKAANGRTSSEAIWP